MDLYGSDWHDLERHVNLQLTKVLQLNIQVSLASPQYTQAAATTQSHSGRL